MHRYELKHAGRQMQCRSQGQTCMHEHMHSHTLIHKCTCTHKESPSPLLYLTAPGWGGGRDSPAYTPASLPRTAWLPPLQYLPLSPPQSNLLH